MSTFHLWFQEPPELSLDSPPDPVPLLMSALYYVFTVWEYVCIRPYALIYDEFSYRLRLFILLRLGALD